MAGVPITTQIDQAIEALSADLNAELASSTHPYQAIWRSSLRRGCLIPTGSFACGVWNKGDDIHLIYSGPVSHDLYWKLVHENLALASSEKLEKERRSGSIELSSRALSKGVQKDGGVVREFARLSRRDQAACRFYLHYLAGSWAQSSEDTSRERHLELLGDTQMLIKTLSDEQMRYHFRALYPRLYRWTQRNGLFGPKFGFLASNHLVALAHGALPRTFPPEVDMLDEEVAEAFQAEKFPLIKGDLRLLCRQLTSGETFSTLASAANLSAATQRIHDTLTPEAKVAVEEVLFWEEQASTDGTILSSPHSVGYSHFLTDHAYFFHVNSESWSLDGRAHFQDYDVPRNISKMIAAFRPAATSARRARYHIRSLRVWPEPLHYSPQQTEQAFLVGINLDADAPQGEHLLKERLADFQDTVEREVLDYNRTTSLITFTLVSRKDLPTLLEGKHTSRETQREEPKPSSPSSSPPETPNPHTTPPPPTQEDSPPPPTTDPTKATPPFRSAHSAISRLRHDPRHTTTEYELGYEDRFQHELIWIPLESWGGKATEDLDFIPEHRVRALRRAEGREVVWDRGRRVDLL